MDQSGFCRFLPEFGRLADGLARRYIKLDAAQGLYNSTNSVVKICSWWTRISIVERLFQKVARLGRPTPARKGAPTLPSQGLAGEGGSPRHGLEPNRHRET